MIALLQRLFIKSFLGREKIYMAYSLEETKHMNGICFKVLENNSNIDINNIFFGCTPYRSKVQEKKFS